MESSKTKTIVSKFSYGGIRHFRRNTASLYAPSLHTNLLRSRFARWSRRCRVSGVAWVGSKDPLAGEALYCCKLLYWIAMIWPRFNPRRFLIRHHLTNLGTPQLILLASMPDPGRTFSLRSIPAVPFSGKVSVPQREPRGLKLKERLEEKYPVEIRMEVEKLACR